MDRIKAATAKIDELKKSRPEGRDPDRAGRAVARLLGVNPYHVSTLLNKGRLTPTMHRALIKRGYLEAPTELVPTEPCWCGVVHPVGWCIYEEGPPIKPKPPGPARKRRPRFSAAADDPALAFQQIEKYYPGQFLLLEEEQT